MWYLAAIFKIKVVYDAILVKDVAEVVFNIEEVNSLLGVAAHTDTGLNRVSIFRHNGPFTTVIGCVGITSYLVSSPFPFLLVYLSI